jgi:hypothetical protein
MNPDIKEIQVAKITSRQAIIVAIISALSGLAGAVISAHFRPEMATASAAQHFIKLPTKIEGLPLGASVRIVADVNGEAFSYPTRYLWMDINRTMPLEKFPLPPSQDKFNVKFKVFVRSPDGGFEEVETNTNTVPALASPSPLFNECTALLSDSGFVRGTADIVIHYEID